MAKAKDGKADRVTLLDKVNDAIKKEELDKGQGRHYRAISKALDTYESDVDKYTADFIEKVGASHKKHKRPEDLYLALIKHVAGLEKVKNSDKIEKLDDLSDDDLAKVRNHLNINYGIPNEGELRKLLDTVVGGEYKTEDEVKEALRQLAHRKGQHDISKKAAAWTSDKEWILKAGEDGTHYKFLQLITDHHSPESAPNVVDTYKSADEAIRYVGTIAQEAYQTKKAARHKK